jgi:hypothetical protein
MVPNPGLVAVALVVACGAAVAQAPSDASWEAEVRAAEEQHRKAFLANDAAALSDMLSDDFLVNSPLNTVVDKKQLVDMVRAGTLTLVSFEQQFEQIRRLVTSPSSWEAIPRPSLLRPGLRAILNGAASRTSGGTTANAGSLRLARRV